MKILLLGGTGQVGHELQRSLGVLGELAVPGQGGIPRIDLAEGAGLRQAINTIRPDVIVNAAAYTAVDKAETERDAATAVNAAAPAIMAEAARQLGAALVHYSTDYVFDGSGNAPRKESDTTGPLNHYGRSKLEGEAGVQAHLPRHLIFRTSWVYGLHGRNFPKTMLALMRERDSLTIVSDQVGVPTSAAMLADATAQAMRHALQMNEGWGLYHLVPGGETNWCALAEHVLARANVLGLLQRRPALQAVLSASYPQAALRPLNSRLDTSKFRQSFGLQLPEWQVPLEAFLQQLAGQGH
ncbi:MAG: dTDP-4-dehydrorhamnose reductase [Alphaproteobacteria bacterium]|nr:dTDP-4-dehydrorhamnose reductase [Alphaproteobacteria bacterium]